VSQVTRTERVKASLFLLIGLVVTGAVVLILRQEFFKPPRTYFLRFTDSVSGLEEGAPVRYKGVKYGKVGKIRVDESDLETITVELLLDENAPITNTTIAEIASSTIVSSAHIELSGNLRMSERLKEGRDIPTSTSTIQDLLATGETLAEKLPEFVVDAQQLVVDAQQLIKNLAQWADKTNKDKFSGLLAELVSTVKEANQTLILVNSTFGKGGDGARLLKESADLAEEVVDILKRNGPQIDKLVFHLVASVERLESLLASGTVEETALSYRRLAKHATDEVDRSGAAVRKWMKDNQAIPYLARAVASIERLEKRVAAAVRTGVTPTLDELGETVASLRRLIELLEKQPNALIFPSPPAKKPLPGGAKR
jgi:ABC-type transporter Mla subunit MlaD